MSKENNKVRGRGEKRKRSQKFITPIGIISFPCIYKPDTDGPFADDKYKATLLVSKDKEAEIKQMKQMVLSVAREEWGDKVKYSDLETPFHDGDEKAENYNKNAKSEGKDENVGKYDNYRKHIFLTAKSTRKPGIVGPDRKELMDGDDIQGGDFVRLSLVAFTYERPATVIENGKKATKVLRGVALSLQNIQKVKTGERFAGGGNAASDFDEIESSELGLDEDIETETSATKAEDEMFDEADLL